MGSWSVGEAALHIAVLVAAVMAGLTLPVPETVASAVRRWLRATNPFDQDNQPWGG
jgi:hypothetical protein